MKYTNTFFTIQIYVLLLFFISCLNCMSADAEEYHLATYNIDVNQKTWKNRCSNLCNLILFNNFDIFGTQEVSSSQFNDLNSYLKDIYSVYGVGREDGKNQGERCPIFYKKNKFKLLSSNTFWLSDNPDKPSKGWDAACNRICSWVRLQDKNSQTEIWFFNTHIDHAGIKARTESCKLLINKIKQICPTDANVVLTGDLNLDQNNSNYKILSESNLLKDSYLAAKYKWAPTGTFPNKNLGKKTVARIDHIFISKSANVLTYGVLNNFYFKSNEKTAGDEGKTNTNELKNKELLIQAPSDHYPVSVFVEFQNSNEAKTTDNTSKVNNDTIKNKILKKIFK